MCSLLKLHNFVPCCLNAFANHYCFFPCTFVLTPYSKIKCYAQERCTPSPVCVSSFSALFLDGDDGETTWHQHEAIIRPWAKSNILYIISFAISDITCHPRSPAVLHSPAPSILRLHICIIFILFARWFVLREVNLSNRWHFGSCSLIA